MKIIFFLTSTNKIDYMRDKVYFGVGAFNSKKGCFQRKNSSGNLNIFLGIGKFLGKNEVIKLHGIFSGGLRFFDPNFWVNSRFLEGF